MSLSHEEAAARLGVPAAEVAGVRDTTLGPVVTTVDGREYVLTDAGELAFYGDAPQHTAFPVVQRVVEAPPPSPDGGDSATDGAGGDSGEDPVPEGSAKQILDWVSADRDRAARALALERGRGDDARSTLVAALEKLVG